MTKRQNKERLVNVFLSGISYQQNKGDGWWEDVKDIVDTVAENYHDEYYEEHDEYHPSIHHTQVYMNAAPHISSPYNMDLTGMMEETLDRSIQPIQYPPAWEVNVNAGCILLEDDDANESCILLADEEESEVNTSATGTQQPILVVPDG